MDGSAFVMIGVGMFIMLCVIWLCRGLIFNKDYFDIEKARWAQIFNPFVINHSNVLGSKTTTEITLNECITKFPDNCFSNNNTTNASTFCSSLVDLTPFGTLGGTLYAPAGSITSNLLTLYSDTTLDVNETSGDIFSVSNVITLGACYIADKMDAIAPNTNCIDAQGSLKAEGIHLSNAQMNTMFLSCTLDATGKLLTPTATIGSTAPTFTDTTLATKCADLGMSLA